MLEIQFELLREGAKLPEFRKQGDVAADIYLPKEYHIYPLYDAAHTYDPTYIRTGLRAKCPPGYHLEVYLRSSTPIKYPGLILANHVGLIDEGYCGPEDEICLVLANLSNATYTLSKGERIVQLKLEKTLQFAPKLIRKDKDNGQRTSSNHSRGGFGSTG